MARLLSSTRSHASTSRAPAARRHHLHRRMRTVLATLGVATLAGSFALGGVLLAAVPASAATSITVDQCNDVLASAQGATTGMDCAVDVVNTISHGVTGSVTTVTRTCSLAPCAPGNGTFVTRSTSLVSRVIQCNGSGNDAAHPTTCSVTITNNISSDTPGATPVATVTSNQCVGSGQGGGGSVVCDPFPATTTGATVTQCNGSGNGGGGTVHCTIPPSRISGAVPVTVNQCNGTANPGGSVLTCTVRITTTVVTAAASPSATSTSVSVTGTPTPGSGTSGTSGASGTGGSTHGTTTGVHGTTVGNVARTPSGGVAAGDGTPTGAPGTGWIVAGLALMTGAGLLGIASRTRTSAVRLGRHR